MFTPGQLKIMDMKWLHVLGCPQQLLSNPQQLLHINIFNTLLRLLGKQPRTQILLVDGCDSECARTTCLKQGT